VGGGDDFGYLQNLTQQLGISNQVVFCGRVAPSDVVNYYHISDISVDPVFDDEGGKARVPLKLLESLACGVPFVTSDVGDRSLLLGDPPAGILTRPGDPHSFARGIETILNNQYLNETLGTLAKKQVLLYTWDKLAKQLDGFYRDNLTQALNRSKNHRVD